MKNFTLSLTAVIFCGFCASAEEASEPIYDVPDGEKTLMSRDCESFEFEAFESVRSKVIGSITNFVTTDNGEVYIGNPISGYPVDSWLKAVKEGNTLSIRGVQPIYEEYDYDTEESYMVYVMPMEIKIDENQQGTCVPAADMRYDLILNDAGVYESVDHNKMLGVCIKTADMAGEDTADQEYYWTGFGDRDIKISSVNSKPVEIPDGSEMQKWLWKDQYETSFANVIFNGNDVYVSGMYRNIPDAWIKGTVNGDKVYFPSGQYLGPDYSIGYLSYFCGAEFELKTDPDTGEEEQYASMVENAIFDYDKEGQTLLTVNGYIINSSADRLYPLYFYDQVNLEYYTRDVNAVPAAPYDLAYVNDYDKKLTVKIPNVDVDGKLLDVNDLYYEILLNDEPLVFDPEVYYDFSEATTLIPYNMDGYDIYAIGTDHTVYLYTEEEGVWGVRSVYVNENGETLYSDIITTEMNSIDNIASGKKVAGEIWHDIYGRRINRPSDGIAICTTIYSDGSATHRKIIVK